jgi:hypothetical protein
MRGNRIDEPYLTWVRQQECCAPSELAGGHPCSGEGVAHHIESRGMGGGSRDDRMVAPLCDWHHKRYHDARELYPEGPGRTKARLFETAVERLHQYEDEFNRRVCG